MTQMRPNVLLIGASLLSILLCTFHLTDDIVHGWEPGTLSNLYALPILVVWLYGTLLLRERLSGYIVMLLGSLVSVGIGDPHERKRYWGREQSRRHQRSSFLCVDAHHARRERT